MTTTEARPTYCDAARPAGIAAAALIAVILLSAVASPARGQDVVIESTEPAEDAVSVPAETVVKFHLNKPTPAMGSEFVSKFRWGPANSMALSVFGHDFDDENELTIIFFTMEHDAETDFSFWAFGVRAEDNSRMAAPFALNYTTAATTGEREVSGSLQFGERSVGGPSKAGTLSGAARTRLGEHVGFLRRSLAASGVSAAAPGAATTPGPAAAPAAAGKQRGLNPDAYASSLVEAFRAARSAAASSAQPTIGYSVALLLDSYSLNDQVWSVRKAAAADATGAFTFDRVRDGTYYPVALNYTDVTGSTVGSYGFYDADGDLEPDPIEVSGGNVIGIDFDLYAAGAAAAQATLDLAYDLAFREADDARLVRVRSLDGPVFQSVYDDGSADLWGYTFHSASLESLIYVAIDPINVFVDVDDDFGYNRGVIADLAVGSDQALAVADANGGDDFRAQYSGQQVPVYMDAGDLDLQVRPAAGEVFWRVRYRSPAGNPVDAELNVFVDVETGEVLPAMGVANERDPAVPTFARIAAAYPNPFATETTLELELDRPADVRLQVFDVLGREVETVVDGRRGIGIHRATWRPAADLPVGIYIVRLEAGTAVRTTSVLLAR